MRPPPLSADALVQIVSPAGPATAERIDAGVAVLEGWGLRVAFEPPPVSILELMDEETRASSLIRIAPAAYGDKPRSGGFASICELEERPRTAATEWTRTGADDQIKQGFSAAHQHQRRSWVDHHEEEYGDR